MFKKIRKFLILFLVVQFFAVSITNAAFRNMNWHTRARGMGGAFSAVSNDLGAMTYNIAGLSWISWKEFNFMYSKLHMGLENVDLALNYAGFAYPMGMGTLGVDWGKFTSLDLYSEDKVNIAYGMWYNDFLALGLGVSGYYYKYTLDSYAANDPVFSSGKSKTNFGVNLGLLYNTTILEDKSLSVGISGSNLNKPDMGFKSKDIIAPEYRLGVSLNFPIYKEILSTLTPAIDFQYRDQAWGDANDKFLLALGVETTFFYDVLALRVGWNKFEFTTGFSVLKTQIKEVIDVGLDYAYVFPLIMDNSSGTHQLSLVIRYGTEY